MAGVRHYTIDEIATALAVVAACDGNVYKAAKQIGMPSRTLRNWVNGEKRKKQEQAAGVLLPDGQAVVGGEGGSISPAVGQALPLLAGKRKSLADRLDDIAWKIVGTVKRADIQAAPVNQRMVALGIAIDKSRLLRGEPGQITADATAPAPDLSRLSTAERDALEDLLAKAEGKLPTVGSQSSPDALPPDALPWERQAHGSTHDSQETREILPVAGDS